MKRGGGRRGGGVGCVVGEIECSVPRGGTGWRMRNVRVLKMKDDCINAQSMMS